MPFSYLVPLAVVGALIVGTVSYRYGMTSAQSLRLSFAEKGEQFLARSDVPEKLRHDVVNMLDDAFPSSPLFMVVAALLAPILVSLAHHSVHERGSTLSAANCDVRGLYLELCKLHRRIGAANHPVMQPVLEFEVAMILGVSSVRRSVTSIGTEITVDRDGMLMSMEQQQRQLRLAPARRGM